MAAAASCSPVRYTGEFSIGIATSLSTQEIWGIQNGDCITYSEVVSLNAFGQDVPDADGMLTLCVYDRPEDLQLEWDVFYGRAEGTFGGTAGMFDPNTGIARTSKDIDGRQIAVCDTYMAAAIEEAGMP